MTHWHAGTPVSSLTPLQFPFKGGTRQCRDMAGISLVRICGCARKGFGDHPLSPTHERLTGPDVTRANDFQLQLLINSGTGAEMC